MSSRGIAIALAASTALTVAAASAQAAPVVVGSPLTAAFTQTTTHYVGTATNTALPEAGARLTSPVAGAVRRWRLQATGTHRLRVLRPNGDGTYTAIATSAPGQGTGAQTATFATTLPVRAGDVIGIDDSSTADTIGIASVPGAGYGFWIPALADGASGTPTPSFPGGELAFNADVVPAPAISGLGVAGGPAAGGTTVVLTGTDFTGASAVSFGGAPATSYTVDSDSQITAVAPAGSPGAVDVRVTTPSGTSAPARFTYLAPAVPLLPPVPGKAAFVGAPRAIANGVAVTVSCAGPVGGTCSLATRLVVVVRKRGGRIVHAASVQKAKKAKRAYLTVGARKAKIAAGGSTTVDITLSKAGRALLKRFKRLPVRVVSTYSATNGAPAKLPARRVVIKKRR